MPFLFEVLKTDADGGRCGRLSTPHGVVETPFFLPVGTQASVKALTQEVLEELGVEIILANTYHLYLRPGHELVRRFGGLHRFMSWPRAILTDSGGYQVFSLSELRKVTDEGVRFRSHLDGSEHLLTPEKVAEIQLALGSDIAMVLDECIETPAPRETAEAALQRTTAWARRARAYFQESAHRNGTPVEQWQFGIVQGATFADLRRESARQLLDLDFPGYAVGGLAVGEPHEVTCAMTAEVTALLPKDRPRYLMGVGRPEQIADYVALGMRAAHSRRTSCLPLHQRRPRAHQELALRRRPAAHRFELLLQRLPPLFAGVSPPSFRRRGNDGRHPSHLSQRPLLP